MDSTINLSIPMMPGAFAYSSSAIYLIITGVLVHYLFLIFQVESPDDCSKEEEEVQEDYNEITSLQRKSMALAVQTT
ncbi:hypothetical protein BU24DRAFT_463135 [Aaosphaeria arxii CBS 175.79]|uniref:Uncharacterized protein n=1 Tax=Aaosphaeria arxii CBS 175.79 TaxID=1450172 RepID=A0A6A5XNB1_9PLEO|nr:uncharacterized protein BU24DRAFT_463135 [Aaosphaeria arxii CBS 175.79]KAF2014337.1 hypothetical protein BU24DRAFT_463135 [Aaosphaeria arxii CBS 175.79]